MDTYQLYGGDDVFYPGGDVDPYSAAMTPDEDRLYRRYSEEYEQGEGFGEFTTRDPFVSPEMEFKTTYALEEQISRGGVGLGTGITGKLSKTEKILQQQTISKEKLYLAKFAAELSNYLTDRNTQYYVTQVEEKIPRFWLKNVETLVIAILLSDRLGDKQIDRDVLKKYSQEYQIRIEDLFRYYRLVKQYIK